MKPEQFIREKLKDLFGEETAKEFDRALAEGLPCELCGKMAAQLPPGQEPKPRRFEGAADSDYPKRSEALRGARPPKERHRASMLNWPAAIPIELCDECAKRVEGSAARSDS